MAAQEWVWGGSGLTIAGKAVKQGSTAGQVVYTDTAEDFVVGFLDESGIAPTNAVLVNTTLGEKFLAIAGDTVTKNTSCSIDPTAGVEGTMRDAESGDVEVGWSVTAAAAGQAFTIHFTGNVDVDQAVA